MHIFSNALSQFRWSQGQLMSNVRKWIQAFDRHSFRDATLRCVCVSVITCMCACVCVWQRHGCSGPSWPRLFRAPILSPCPSIGSQLVVDWMAAGSDWVQTRSVAPALLYPAANLAGSILRCWKWLWTRQEEIKYYIAKSGIFGMWFTVECKGLSGTWLQIVAIQREQKRTFFLP